MLSFKLITILPTIGSTRPGQIFRFLSAFGVGNGTGNVSFGLLSLATDLVVHVNPPVPGLVRGYLGALSVASSLSYVPLHRRRNIFLVAARKQSWFVGSSLTSSVLIVIAFGDAM